MIVHRTDDELRAQSPHVFWHLRQVLRLAAHLEHCRREGRNVMLDALDAAALEAFTVSARALVEFFWTEHKLGKDRARRYPYDARAADWFAGQPKTWTAGEKPPVLVQLTEKVGWGVAHVSFRRIDPEQEWGWQHLDISHHLACRFADFASQVPPNRVTPDFESEVFAEAIAYREQTDPPMPIFWDNEPVGPVGTPGHATLIATLRDPPAS